ncbi:MAG TPA: aminotransferase class III-fold pyridoxal phosphate-dependent enzyme, partial [Acidimicrobiales bacterium]|nr:aminotransferase class III-fold pyridoxal phosphate-dependent enzyme [Acidimicrobiales bacterium]
ATAAIGVLRDQRLAERAARMGPPMLEALGERLEGVPGVAEVRGLGLWAGVEIEDAEGRPDPQAAARAVRRAREDGVLVGRGGHAENVVKLSPPLVIEEDALDDGVQTVAGAIRHVMEGVRA